MGVAVYSVLRPYILWDYLVCGECFHCLDIVKAALRIVVVLVLLPPLAQTPAPVPEVSQNSEGHYKGVGSRCCFSQHHTTLVEELMWSDFSEDVNVMAARV
ncbi:hypothetical protein O3P69_015989 [Scylla paramamosain]|uniref:Uncharacterized protein n=1 Tax=Scylla paramamosain TaxID=85552 RepID=A0AAW0T9B1_SCYPA